MTTAPAAAPRAYLPEPSAEQVGVVVDKGLVVDEGRYAIDVLVLPAVGGVAPGVAVAEEVLRVRVGVGLVPRRLGKLSCCAVDDFGGHRVGEAISIYTALNNGL